MSRSNGADAIVVLFVAIDGDDDDDDDDVVDASLNFLLDNVVLYLLVDLICDHPTPQHTSSTIYIRHRKNKNNIFTMASLRVATSSEVHEFICYITRDIMVGRFDERADLLWQRDTIAVLVIIVVVFSICYYLVVFSAEVMGATPEWLVRPTGELIDVRHLAGAHLKEKKIVGVGILPHVFCLKQEAGS